MKVFQLLSLFTFFSYQYAASYIDYESPYHPVVGSSGMVVTQNYLSSEIGIEILNRGGNAIDAAVAVGFSLAITLPRAGNIGGGGFMLVYLKERDEIFFIDYRSQSPLNTNLKDIFKKELPKNYSKINFDTVKKGYKASALPGTVAGLLDAHTSFGSLPLADVLEPVIKQAEEGIIVSYDLHKAIESTPQLLDDKESKRIYFLNDSPLPTGSLMKRLDLANTFKLIAKEGKDAFYKGEIKDKFLKAMNQNDGFLQERDFAEYKINSGAPLVSSYRNNLVFTAAPPSGGGIVLLTSLNILSAYDLNKYGSNSTATYHLIAEALRRGHNNRSHHIGDPSFYDIPISDLFSKQRTQEFVKSINFNKATPSSKIKPLRVANESRDTTHYSIVDKDGNAVSNTYTLGYSFGSGVTIPGTGILMNNQMNNFAYRFGDESIQGRVASPANKYEPGKRPMSTMAPSMVFNANNELILVIGSPGGSYIPAAILRVISGVIDFNLDIGASTMLPRIHKDWPYKGLDYEKIISSDTVRGLNKLGHYPEANKTMGSTQSIHILNGVRYGYSDLRRPNASVSIQNN
jgi:gamma-glutamyltranspeptidase/glutathione hydrolase